MRASQAAAMPAATRLPMRPPTVPQSRGATTSDRSGTTASNRRGRVPARRAPVPVGAAGSLSPGTSPNSDLRREAPHYAVHVIARGLGTVGELSRFEMCALGKFSAGDVVEIRFLKVAKTGALRHVS